MSSRWRPHLQLLLLALALLGVLQRGLLTTVLSDWHHAAGASLPLCHTGAGQPAGGDNDDRDSPCCSDPGALDPVLPTVEALQAPAAIARAPQSLAPRTRRAATIARYREPPGHGPPRAVL